MNEQIAKYLKGFWGYLMKADINIIRQEFKGVQLAPRVFFILVYLFIHWKKVVTKREILENVFNRTDQNLKNETLMRVNIVRLNQKIEGLGYRVKNVFGTGYKEEIGNGKVKK